MFRKNARRNPPKAPIFLYEPIIAPGIPNIQQIMIQSQDINELINRSLLVIDLSFQALRSKVNNHPQNQRAINSIPS